MINDIKKLPIKLDDLTIIEMKINELIDLTNNRTKERDRQIKDLKKRIIKLERRLPSIYD